MNLLATGMGILLVGLGVARAQPAFHDPGPAAQAGEHAVAGAAKSAVDQVFGAGQGAAPEAAPPDANGAPVVQPMAVAERGRDPFRPFTLDLRPETHENEILTPLQRYELPQLRLAGVVLDLQIPRAMLQDNTGMGFIVTPGTPIGRRRGVVKAIEPHRLIVEEHILDYDGREQLHQVAIEMPEQAEPRSEQSR